MKKIVCLILFSVAAINAGCSTIVEAVLSDVGGVDLTACARGPSVCTELFFDNYDRFNDDTVE